MKRRVMNIVVGKEALKWLLGGQASQMQLVQGEPLPDDARILSIAEGELEEIVLTVESSDFPQLSAGSVIPRTRLLYQHTLHRHL